MKYNIKHIILLTVTIILYSCTKDFLNRNPLDQQSAATFWKTKADADQALAAVYSYLIQGYNYTSATNTGQGWGAGTPYWETLTDNAYSSAFSNVAQGAIEATTGTIQSDAYNTSYRAIQACNIFLSNIGNVSMDEALKTTYI